MRKHFPPSAFLVRAPRPMPWAAAFTAAWVCLLDPISPSIIHHEAIPIFDDDGTIDVELMHAEHSNYVIIGDAHSFSPADLEQFESSGTHPWAVRMGYARHLCNDHTSEQ